MKTIPSLVVLLSMTALFIALAGCSQPAALTEEADSKETAFVSQEVSGTNKEGGSEDLIMDGAVVNGEDLDFPLGNKVDSPSFTGDVYLSSMVTMDDTYNFPFTNNIIFSPGARSSWHTHGGMVILGTGGIGYYQEEGKPAQIIRKGDVVECPEGVRHWHGAAPDSWFSQMVIWDTSYVPDENAPADEPVTDAEYSNLETEECQSTIQGDQFMFQRVTQAMESETFSGPAYVSTILDAENAAGAPSLHYGISPEEYSQISAETSQS